MKRRIAQTLIIFAGICGLYYHSINSKPIELVVETGTLRTGASDILETIDISIEESDIETVKEENIDRLEMTGEVDVQSEPVVFPDSYFDPSNEEYKEEEFWDDMELVALVCVAEAEGESELGKRLVIDSIFNRVESEWFPNTIYGVVYDNSQYSCVWDGRLDRVEYNEYIANLVLEELNNRTNSDIVYFKTEGYFGFGTPIMQEGNHYFSAR